MGAIEFHLLSIPLVLLVGMIAVSSGMDLWTRGRYLNRLMTWLNGLPRSIWIGVAIVLAINWARAIYLGY